MLALSLLILIYSGVALAHPSPQFGTATTEQQIPPGEINSINENGVPAEIGQPPDASQIPSSFLVFGTNSAPTNVEDVTPVQNGQGSNGFTQVPSGQTTSGGDSFQNDQGTTVVVDTGTAANTNANIVPGLQNTDPARVIVDAPIVDESSSSNDVTQAPSRAQCQDQGGELQANGGEQGNQGTVVNIDGTNVYRANAAEEGNGSNDYEDIYYESGDVASANSGTSVSSQFGLINRRRCSDVTGSSVDSATPASWWQYYKYSINPSIFEGYRGGLFLPSYAPGANILSFYVDGC